MMPREPHTVEQALAKLAALGAEETRLGMARFGINVRNAYGVSMPGIRSTAAAITQDHRLADGLWRSGMHEARILAGFVDKPLWVVPEQMDRWTSQFDSWDVCDQICGNLWDRAAHRDEKIALWSDAGEEFVKRAAFATMAWRAVHDKKAPDEAFLQYYPMIARAADDDRNFVCKAVNWALRQIGKRSRTLRAHSVALARELASRQERAARWIGKDALRELENIDGR
jgi:3-methyladenine DNA glycosylase AlkD